MMNPEKQKNPQEGEENKAKAINEAMQRIIVIQQNVYAMGNNDNEMPVFESIKARLMSTDPDIQISPEEAMAKAEQVRDSKMER